MKGNLPTILFISIFILIFLILPIIFPHNTFLTWVRNILGGLLLIGLIYDFVTSKRKKIRIVRDGLQKL